MKNIAIVLFLSFCFISVVDAQKRKKIQKLEPIQDSVRILSDVYLDIEEKTHLIHAFKNNLNWELPDMVFFNPYEEWKKGASRYTTYVYTRSDKDGYLGWYTNRFYMSGNADFDVSTYFQPFYFRQYEVTNGEYWEFINWVRDSIAHDLIGNFIEAEGQELIDWEGELNWNDPALEELFIIEDSQPEIIDTDFLVFLYEDENGQEHKILIYPSEKVDWITYYYNEPSKENYFIHPAFYGYPVINVNYYQALAFCQWKEKMLRQELREKGFDYEIEVGLPRAYEWQWMAWNKGVGKGFGYRLQDKGWHTDLMLNYDSGQVLMNSTKNQNLPSPFPTTVDDCVLYINFAKGFYNCENGKKQILQRKDLEPEHYALLQNVDENDVYHMGSNVSEWMSDNYQDGWDSAFYHYVQSLEENGGEAALLARQIAMYYDNLNDKNGQLVYGTNWYDERYSLVQGKNKEGIFAKCFVNPNEAYSTVGFRYVIRIKEKK